MSTPQNDKKATVPPSAEAIEAATQACHQQLHDHRQKIISLYSLFLSTSAAYYTMCDLSGEAPPEGPDLLLALTEFQRRGLIHFTNNSVEQLSKDYVQSLKMLKQVVDNAVGICDRLAMLSTAQRTAQQAVQAAQPPPAPQPYRSLDEALEAELNAEGE